LNKLATTVHIKDLQIDKYLVNYLSLASIIQTLDRKSYSVWLLID